jgi:hypothetical protein
MPKREREAKDEDDFLKELLAEKIELVLKRMDRTDYLRIVQEYISNPGSSITLILNFNESQIEAEISVMKPTVISRESSTPEDPSNIYARQLV